VVDADKKRSMLTILIAAAEVARASDYALTSELADTVDRLIEQAQAEVACLRAEASADQRTRTRVGD
jgi:hypothetical protein